MKRLNVFIMLFAGICLCLASFATSAQVNIMAMGDSVTARGSNPESSYRFWLFVDLTNAGFQWPGDFQFLGRANGVSDGAPSNSWPQEAYEGGQTPGAPGQNLNGDAWTTASGVQDARSAASRLGTGPAVLLLDLGANDYDEGDEPMKTNLLEVQTNLETIIQTFNQANSGTVVLLAVPTPEETSDPIAKQFFADIGSAVTKAAHDEKLAGVEVVVVNLRSGFDPNTNGGDTKDGMHPNVKGEQQIAKKFFNALRPELKKMGIEPQRVRR